MRALLRSSDVAVIGAGPSGCVTALSFAARGARVLLLDGHPQAAKRLAGEWLHPPGVRILRELGLEHVIQAGHRGRGFVIFPQDRSDPIHLRYPNDSFGLSLEHFALVNGLRTAVQQNPNIEFLQSALVAKIEDQKLHFVQNKQYEYSVLAPLIVGADGRSSLARRTLGLSDDPVLVSSMAGVLLEDVELMEEGFGQVLLGGPGPVLACRIGPQQVRLFLDLPCALGRVEKNAKTLWEQFHGVLPEAWLPAFRSALEKQAFSWASNQWRSRLHYGRPGLALVGDAVGHFHPLTAVGMTLGFLDGSCLAKSKNFQTYRRQRSARTGVAELLAMALYKVFTLDDLGTAALREAIFNTWRGSADECLRTMGLLSGEDTRLVHFNRAFLRILASAVNHVMHDSLLVGRWHHAARALHGFGKWLGWLAIGNLPHIRRATVRQ